MERNRLYEGRGNMNGEYNTIRKEKNMKYERGNRLYEGGCTKVKHTHKLNHHIHIEIRLFC